MILMDSLEVFIISRQGFLSPFSSGIFLVATSAVFQFHVTCQISSTVPGTRKVLRRVQPCIVQCDPRKSPGLELMLYIVTFFQKTNESLLFSRKLHKLLPFPTNLLQLCSCCVLDLWEVWSDLQPGWELPAGGRQLRLLHRAQVPQGSHPGQEAAYHWGNAGFWRANFWILLVMAADWLADFQLTWDTAADWLADFQLTWDTAADWRADFQLTWDTAADWQADFRLTWDTAADLRAHFWILLVMAADWLTDFRLTWDTAADWLAIADFKLLYVHILRHGHWLAGDFEHCTVKCAANADKFVIFIFLRIMGFYLTGLKMFLCVSLFYFSI